MGAKEGVKSEIVRIRIPSDLRERIHRLKSQGVHDTFDEVDFLRYLLVLGVGKYEASVLPAERENSGQEVSRRVINQ